MVEELVALQYHHVKDVHNFVVDVCLSFFLKGLLPNNVGIVNLEPLQDGLMKLLLVLSSY